jgi:hypothetical protein
MNDAKLSRRLRELLAQSARVVRAARETCALARRARERSLRATMKDFRTARRPVEFR